ncbi:MAG: GldG family protein, partial [Gammaproteobacteria bacterium]|nr:GldG family protein [Gammaproteobacteria bacterium]
MMDKIKKQKLFSTTGLIAALVLLILINLVSSLIFSSARLDLTENNLYTLSDGTENILESLEEPVTIKFYFSEQVFASVPAIMTYGQRVKDMLKEYASIAGSKLNLQIIDPEPFSEEEDQAVQSNLQGLPLDNAGTTGYFGLVASNTVDDHETIPFLQPEKEVTLEYDLTKLIYKLSNPKKKVVGLMSGLDMTSMGQAQGRFAMPEDWVILNQLKQFYQINKLGTDIGEIPKDIDILLVVHPKDFSDKALYAIDQFLMAGGRAIMFVDPFSEAQPSMADPSNPMAAMNEKRGSNLKKFFDLWGLEMAEDKIAADRLTAARVQARVGARIAPVDYVAWLQLREGNFNQKDFVTAELKQVAVATAGSFKITQKDNIVVTPLIETTDKGSEIP